MNSDDIECPRCKTTKYRNPSLKLQVNVCGHALCETCIELLFVSGAAKCYQCPTPLKRSNYKPQLFQDSQVEKETQVAKEMKKFRKNQDEFPSLRAYNDYLEKLETVIYNLANNIDIEETNTLLEELRFQSTENRQMARMQSHQQQKIIKNEPYYYTDLILDMEGPKMPKIDDGFLRAIRSFSVREVAGGFTAQLAITRALSDAFNGLYLQHG